jgi:hypothetical protein
MNVSNQEQITKLTSLMWKKYNLKCVRPPLAMIRKLAILQGKTKEEASKMEYFKFKEGTKMPWNCTGDEHDEFWGVDAEEDWVPPRSKCMSITSPPDSYSWVRDADGKYPYCYFSPNLIGITKSSPTLNLETPIKDILTGKVPLIEPSPYSFRKSNRGFSVLKNEVVCSDTELLKDPKINPRKQLYVQKQHVYRS